MEPPFRAAEGFGDLHEQVLRLGQEKRELSDYAERVTRELRRYQQARPVPPAKPEDDLPLPPWAMNMQMMSPLLFSYEERIAELEAVIERSASLAEQAQALARENDNLRAELQERTEQLRQAQLVAPGTGAAAAGGASGDGPSAAERMEELQELYRLSVEQNEALAQQNQLLKLQLERMQQGLVVREQQAREVQARAIEGSRVMTIEQEQSREREARSQAVAREWEERSEAIAKQRSAAEQRLEQVTADLAEEVRQREQRQQRFEGLQNEFQLQRQSLEQHKQSFNERCALAQAEEERMRKELGRVSSQEKEQRQKATALEIELAQVREQYYVAKREGDATKQEAEQWVKLMESMERRLKDVSERHDDARAKLGDHESKVSELILERDRVATSEQAAQRAAERMQTRLEAELDTLRQQREQDVNHLQSSHKKDLSDKDERIRKSEQTLGELQMKVELAERQRTWEATALESKNSLHAAERSRLQSDLEESHQARLRLERQVGSAQQEASRLRASLEASAAESREQNSRALAELASSRSKMQTHESALARARDDLQATENRVATIGMEHARIQSELQDERARASDSLETAQRRGQAERRGLERQLQLLTAKAQQDENRAVELLRAQEALRLQWQSEMSLEKEALEGQVERLVAENRTMREKSRGVLQALASRRFASDDLDDTPLALR
mmetsp:Transcript_39817/g.69990  ORF Transcript_39817/g.69990 Transcript_39817/m.69990 type:complete len:686 (+) Transcript_39817:68-2125(+)